MGPSSSQKGPGKAPIRKPPSCLCPLPQKIMAEAVKSNTLLCKFTTSPGQHILPLIFQSEVCGGDVRGRECEGADQVRCVSEVPAHSICGVFCVNFLLSSQAPNSAELKWNEVIRAAD